jgi:hypothetical protein
MQVKLMEDNYPSVDLSIDYMLCQLILEWIHNENGSGLAKHDIVTELLASMNCFQCKFMNMGVVEFWSKQASA